MSSCEPSPLSQPLNEFTISLFHRLSSSEGQENVFLSPFSVGTAMSMLLLAARNESKKQLVKGLLFDKPCDAGHDVHTLFQKLLESRVAGDESLLLSNYVLIQKEEGAENETLKKFKSDLLSLYSAKLDDVNFSTDGPDVESRVNEWVDKSTKGLIQKILDSPPAPDTRLLLLNAIYFRGKWEEPFEEDMTRKMTFFNRAKDEIDTEFMITYDSRYRYVTESVAGEGVQVLDMPYSQKGLSMTIVLPEARNGLEKMLKGESFRTDIQRLLTAVDDSTGTTNMNIFIPKFRLETEYNLNEVLSDMGMTDIFTPAADLSGITGRRDLHVSLVKHKAVVRVDEKGTEAAAVTCIGVRCLMLMPTTDFRADHPFLFLIRDKSTRVVLFVGKVEAF